MNAPGARPSLRLHEKDEDMIEILIGKEEFKNDIYELVKAFYPGEQFNRDGG